MGPLNRLLEVLSNLREYIAGTENLDNPRENWYDIVKVQFIDPDNEYAQLMHSYNPPI